MPKTIWYISKYVVPPKYTYVGARGFQLLKEFSKIGHHATLITSDSNHLAKPPKFETSYKYEVIDGVHVTWLKTIKYTTSYSLRRVLSWIHFEYKLLLMPRQKLSKPDVVIVSSLSLLSILNGLLMRQRYKCKLVLEVRDIWPLTLILIGNFSRNNIAIRFLSWLEIYAYRNVDLIVGTLPNLKEHVLEVSSSSKPVVCIPQGVDLSEYEKSENLPENYEKNYIPKGKFIICHTGSIGTANALGTLIEAAQLLKNHDTIHFLMVGEGALKKEYITKTLDLKNITFAPSISKKAVKSVLQKVDVVYFSSYKSPLLRFGQSLNKLIDYMMSGKPILASYTGYQSMINEADCGKFIPAEDVDALCDEILRFEKMPENKRQQMGARGKEWIIKNRQFSTLAKKYLEHIDAL